MWTITTYGMEYVFTCIHIDVIRQSAVSVSGMFQELSKAGGQWIELNTNH